MSAFEKLAKVTFFQVSGLLNSHQSSFSGPNVHNVTTALNRPQQNHGHPRHPDAANKLLLQHLGSKWEDMWTGQDGEREREREINDLAIPSFPIQTQTE